MSGAHMNLVCQVDAKKCIYKALTEESFGRFNLNLYNYVQED